MPVIVTNNLGHDYLLPNRRVIPDGESVILSDRELEWIPTEKRDPSALEITALAASISVSTEYLATRVDESTGGVTYVGRAVPGTDTSDASWQIQRITETGGDVVVEYANGSEAFNRVWDDRESFAYS